VISAQSGCSGCLAPITVTSQAYQNSYLSYPALYNSGFFTGLASSSPSWASRLWSIATNHPFVAMAAMATVIIGGGPEDPVTDALAAGELSAGGALVPMVDAAYNYGTVQAIAGYEVAGTSGMVGSTYTMNIWGLYATENAGGIGSLAGAIQSQAAALGALDISITGNAIINPSILNMGAVAGRYGFSFLQINPTTIWLGATVVP